MNKYKDINSLTLFVDSPCLLSKISPCLFVCLCKSDTLCLSSLALSSAAASTALSAK